MSKTQQLLTLAKHYFGQDIRQDIQVEYKPGGLKSGWYLNKNDRSYCIGKNEFEAILWLCRVPNLIK